jgi:hypothetical protein
MSPLLGLPLLIWTALSGDAGGPIAPGLRTCRRAGAGYAGGGVG